MEIGVGVTSRAPWESGRGDAGRCEKTTRFSKSTPAALRKRNNAKTSNVDKMTAKHLFSGHSESQTYGAESSELGTAALAKRVQLLASDSDDDGLRRPVKKRAADRACKALVPVRPEPVDDGSGS